jgi:predicted metal-dependent hydrolase
VTTPGPKPSEAISPERILQGGRAKAYRPLPLAVRRRAIRAGLAAYRRGDFFEAHEVLEPAWMGTADLAERDALQGLIKLAAAYVHAVRGNAIGVAKNLAGAQERLDRAAGEDGPVIVGGVDSAAVAAAIGARLRALREAGPAPLDSHAIFALVPPPALEAGR